MSVLSIRGSLGGGGVVGPCLACWQLEPQSPAYGLESRITSRNLCFCLVQEFSLSQSFLFMQVALRIHGSLKNILNGLYSSQSQTLFFNTVFLLLYLIFLLFLQIFFQFFGKCSGLQKLKESAVNILYSLCRDSGYLRFAVLVFLSLSFPCPPPTLICC